MRIFCSNLDVIASALLKIYHGIRLHNSLSTVFLLLILAVRVNHIYHGRIFEIGRAAEIYVVAFDRAIVLTWFVPLNDNVIICRFDNSYFFNWIWPIFEIS
jgi:hypothetical protein